jgi:hypothetical protein
LEAHRKWRYCLDIGKQQIVGNGVTLVVRGNVSLNNKSKYRTELKSDRIKRSCSETMKILKQNLILVAASAFKLHVKDWTILHSRW